MFSPVVVSEGLFIPTWRFEDTPVPYITKTEDGYLSNIDYEDYRQLVRQSYYSCVWYPKMQQIPTIPSVLTTLSDLEQTMKECPDYRFIRTCGSSPKDLTVPIFDHPEEAERALLESSRTSEIFKQGHDHVMLREVVEIEIECRCFVHERVLRAVSIYCYLKPDEFEEFKKEIIEFFDLYAEKLPYNSAVIEVCTAKGCDFPMVIEFNSFGIDQYSGASLFDWHKDKELLYHSPEPVFRIPDEFSWT